MLATSMLVTMLNRSSSALTPARHGGAQSPVSPAQPFGFAHASASVVRTRAMHKMLCYGAQMRSIDEGGEVPAWLACAARSEIAAAGGGGTPPTGFFMPDKSVVGWVAD